MAGTWAASPLASLVTSVSTAGVIAWSALFIAWSSREHRGCSVREAVRGDEAGSGEDESVSLQQEENHVEEAEHHFSCPVSDSPLWMVTMEVTSHGFKLLRWKPLLLGGLSWVGGEGGGWVKMRWAMYEVELPVGGQENQRDVKAGSIPAASALESLDSDHPTMCLEHWLVCNASLPQALSANKVSLQKC